MGASDIKLDGGGPSSVFHAPGNPNHFVENCPLSQTISTLTCVNIVRNAGWKIRVSIMLAAQLEFTLNPGEVFPAPVLCAKSSSEA